MTAEQYELLNNIAIAGSAYENYELDEQPMWKNVGPLCNGYGRMIHYIAYADSGEARDFKPDATQYTKNKIVAIREGYFQNGNLHGYGKVYKDNEVYAGFFENNLLQGKGVVYPLTPNSLTVNAIWDEGQIIHGDYDITDFTTNDWGA